jgi:hypothetical protein
MRWPSPWWCARSARRRRAGALLSAAALAGALSCGGGGSRPPSAVILAGPEDTAVFEGQTALFRVRASGTDGVTYQWRRDGVAIPGAVDSHLLTPPTAPADDGAAFSVAVTNAGARAVESAAARLTVRPPLDLRFQWVGAPFTPVLTVGTNLLLGISVTYGGAGTPLLIGTGCGGPGNCSWDYAVAGGVPGMTITYATGRVQDLGPAWAVALPPDTVVTSLDLQAPSDAYAVALARTTQAGTFTPVLQGAVLPDQLPITAATEGAHGRVITAVSRQGGLVSYVSYGWSRNGSTTYETEVVTSALGGAGAAAAGLAAQGYVITACGAGEGGTGGLILVGTRVQGATGPRPLAVAVGSPLPEGYPVVAYVYDPVAGTITLIGER